MQGARIVRMHNVPESVDAVRIVEAILGWREPAYLKHNMVDGRTRNDERHARRRRPRRTPRRTTRLDDRATPRVRMNFVMSLDGAVTLDGSQRGLGDETDRLAMQVLRTLADVVRRRCRHGAGRGVRRGAGRRGGSPRGGARTDCPSSRASRSSRRGSGSIRSIRSSRDATTRPIVVTHAAAPADRREALAEVADVLVCGDTSVDAAAMLAALAERGLPQVLCEGGPHLFGSLLEADLVDELCLSLSPLLVGGDAGRIARGAPEVERRMRLVHAIPAGDVLLLR